MIDQAPLIPLLPHLLHHPNPSIRLHVAFLISNLCAGNYNQVKAVLNLPNGPFTLLSHLISRVSDVNEDWKVRRESSWALGNLTDILRESMDQEPHVMQVHKHLIKQGLILGVLEMMRLSSPDQQCDASCFLRMVDALVNLLWMARLDKRNVVAQYVESIKGADLLFELTKNYCKASVDTPISAMGRDYALAAEAVLPVSNLAPEFRKAIKNVNIVMHSYFSTWLDRKRGEKDVDWLTDTFSFGMNLAPSSKGKVIA